MTTTSKPSRLSRLESRRIEVSDSAERDRSFSSPRSAASMSSASSSGTRSASSRRISRANSTMSAAEIGLLSSTFFFSFAAAQIPLGICLDRYGAKICMLVCAGIAAAGAVLFALGTSPGMLIAARVLMGVGSCCYLMAPLALYAKRYPPEKFGTLVGFQLGVGTLGTLLATAPLAWSVSFIGWRASFLAVAGLMVFAGTMVALVVHEDEPRRRRASWRASRNIRESIAGLKQALRGDIDRAAFLLSSRGLFELRAGGRPVGRAVSHAYLRLQPDRARRHAVRRRGRADRRRVSVRTDRPDFPRLQDSGFDRRAADRTHA